jgi:hypothetical protein
VLRVVAGAFGAALATMATGPFGAVFAALTTGAAFCDAG